MFVDVCVMGLPNALLDVTQCVAGVLLDILANCVINGGM